MTKAQAVLEAMATFQIGDAVIVYGKKGTIVEILQLCGNVSPSIKITLEDTYHEWWYLGSNVSHVFD